jgi:hypothetical protein
MALCGCASDEAASRFLVQPDRYFLYNCEALATAAQANAVRQRELEALMTKAGVDTGGRLVSSMAYRPECLQLRGQMEQLRKTAAEKTVISRRAVRDQAIKSNADTGGRLELFFDRELIDGTRHSSGPRWGQAWAF